MEALGPKIRRQRRRLGLTLDELAGRTGISKPYLSLIETGRVPNPPSDEKLRRLEQTLGFPAGELLSQAHLQRTPKDVRAMLRKLVGEGKEKERTEDSGLRTERENKARLSSPSSSTSSSPSSSLSVLSPQSSVLSSPSSVLAPHSPLDLDDAYLSGVLQRMVGASGGEMEPVASNAVPVINRVSAGYPKDFTDLSYPPRVADDYVGCPDVRDKDAFAARVHGDSMVPKYRPGDIVIFSPAAPARTGDDCFVRFADGQSTFKRVFFETGDGGGPSLRLQPRNEKYRPLTIPSDQVAGLYRAVYKYQRVEEE